MIVPPIAWMVQDRARPDLRPTSISSGSSNFACFWGTLFAVLVDFGPFLASWTLRRIPFYGFVHFAAFQMLAGVQFKVRMGKPSTEGVQRGMRRVPPAALVSACRLAFDGDFGPIIQSIFDQFWSAFLQLDPCCGPIFCINKPRMTSSAQHIPPRPSPATCHSSIKS